MKLISLLKHVQKSKYEKINDVFPCYSPPPARTSVVPCKMCKMFIPDFPPPVLKHINLQKRK